MFCGECGTQNPDTNAFCKNCGKPLKKTSAPAPAAAPAPQPAPAAQPAAPAQPSYYIPPAGAQPQAQPAAATAAAIKPKRNWAGIGSLILAILSWILYPVLLGIFAVVAGAAGIYLAKKQNSKIPISAILGIVIGLLAIVINIFWLDIFPPESVLPPIQ